MASGLANDLRALPNLITLSRLVLLAAAAVVYFQVSHRIGLLLGIAAGVTDYLDGAVARATGRVTRLGEILDQLSDLVFESTLLLFVVVDGFISPLVLCAYLLREFWVMSIRRFTAGQGGNIASGWWGKLKTNFLMWGLLLGYVSLSGVLLPRWPGLQALVSQVGRSGILAGIFLGYVGGWRYTRQFIEHYDAVVTPQPMGGPDRPGAAVSSDGARAPVSE